MAERQTEQTESWINHCLESNYGSTTVQIDSAGCSPRLTQHTLERVHFAGKSLEYVAHEKPECREEERREM